ncbi:MAG: bacteriocin fulvocin C-related protein [Niastella sp.]|nr:bacteriocin fulvocin C-related protein [Niastella sp.]
MYKTLNPSEKYFAWETKYDKLISATNLTSEQTAFVRKLKSNLSKEIFEKGNNAVKDKLQTLEPIFKKEAIELFGISGAYELMANLNPESNLQQYPPGQGDCDCSKKSDWCPSGHACLRVGCVIVEDDCGWWWSYDCTGDCWIDV